jgi:pimeloyl-ACP methyl ester carboxylesterase
MMTHREASSAAAGHYVRANGPNIYCEEHGIGEPLLLLQSDTLNLGMRMQHIPKLVRYFNVVASYRRGRDRTKNPADTLSYRLQVEDPVALVQALGLTRPLECGYNGGGTIALEMGMNCAGLVKAYVAWRSLISPASSVFRIVERYW